MKFSVLHDMSVGASACEHFFSTCLAQHLPGSEPGGGRKFRAPPTLTTNGGQACGCFDAGDTVAFGLLAQCAWSCQLRARCSWSSLDAIVTRLETRCSKRGDIRIRRLLPQATPSIAPWFKNKECETFSAVDVALHMFLQVGMSNMWTLDGSLVCENSTNNTTNIMQFFFLGNKQSKPPKPRRKKFNGTS